MTIRILTCAMAGILVLGCGPGPEPQPEIPAQASFCGAVTGAEPTETRKVELGHGPASDFEPYSHGEEINVVTGGQGATMITPFVRVEKKAADGPEACFRVRLAEGDLEFSSEWNIQFQEEGGSLVSDGALYFITYSTEDVELILTVEGDGFSATSSVNVVLR